MTAPATVIGNLTRDPELRYTTGGRAVASMGVASSRRYQRNGEWEEEVSFFNVVAWGDLGEHVAQSLVKGNRVIVVGRWTQRSYDDREGNKRSVIEVMADSIGPDLRWATCEVDRVVREGGDASPRPRQSSGGGRAHVSDPVYGDEEPF